MKALNLLGNRKVEVVTAPDPQPGPGEVRVKMRASGLCGSDLHLAERPLQPRAHELIIPGHEPAGVVEKLGENVKHLKIGDRVTINHYVGCGHCHHCFGGAMWWCQNDRKVIGGNPHGAHAEYVVAAARNCCVLPDDFSFEEGALIACATGTSYSALRKLHPSGNETLVVVGLGPVGLAGVGLGAAMGAQVTAIGRREDRLRLAKELGAHSVIDIDAQDALEAVKEILPDGADLLFETSGAKEAHGQIPKMLAKGGRAVLVGFGNKEPSLNLSEIIWAQQTLIGSFVMPLELYRPLVQLMKQNELRLDGMVTHRFALEEGPQAFELAFSKECGKIVFSWDE